MWKLILSALLVAATLRGAAATCNVCNSNGIACISTNEFQNCYNGEIDTSVTFKCPVATQVCTFLHAGCMEPTGSITGACGDTSKCGDCTGIAFGYACNSRTTFSMCVQGAAVDSSGTCPDTQTCSINKGKTGANPCVDACEARTSLLCDRTDPSTVPTPSPPTPSPPTPSPPTPSPPTPSPPTPSPPTPSPPTPSPPTPSPPTPSPPTPSPPTPSPPTPSPPTPSPPTQGSTPDEVCASVNLSGRFPYPNDKVCTHYVNCYMKSGALVGVDISCPANTYYNGDPNVRACQSTKPASCI